MNTLAKSLEDKLTELVGEEDSIEIQVLIDDAVHLGLYKESAYKVWQNTIKNSPIYEEDKKYFKIMNDALLDQYQRNINNGIDEYNAKKMAYFDSFLQHFINLAENKQLGNNKKIK